jgi:predicted Zn-dependent protease
MSILSEAQAKTILQKVIALSKADETSAQLTGGLTGNVRFARNDVSTSGIVDDTQLGVQVVYGKKVGTATINQFDDASLQRVVQRASDLAKLAPDNPEFMPAVGKQAYKATDTFSAATAALTAEARARIAQASI